jgi:hypothetical protein
VTGGAVAGVALGDGLKVVLPQSVCFELCADSEVKQGKLLCPLLVCVAHDGCLQRPVEAFHEIVRCWMVSGCPGKPGSGRAVIRTDDPGRW